jgi:hypothetical protein
MSCGDLGHIIAGSPGWAFWRKRFSRMATRKGPNQGHSSADRIDACEGVTWITSKRQMGGRVISNRPFPHALNRAHHLPQSSSHAPVLMDCRIPGTFRFSSGQGAMLAMDNNTISTIDPPGSLCWLLVDSTMQGHRFLRLPSHSME